MVSRETLSTTALAIKRERKTYFLGVSFSQTSGLNDSLAITSDTDVENYEKDYEIELLLIADHSMFEGFSDLYHGDEFAAFHGLSDYLRGLFDQVTIIFVHNFPN